MGLRPAQRAALERTFRRKVTPQQVVSAELARHLAALSHDLGRQTGVLLSREGVVRSVILGDAGRLELPDPGRLRAGSRFRGLRLVHTHLGGEPVSHDDLNDLALLRLDLVAVIHVTPEGDAGAIELAHILPVIEDGDGAGDGNGAAAEPFRKVVARDIFALDFDFEAEMAALEAEFARSAARRVGRAAGAEIAEIMQFSGGQIHPRTVIGRGRLERVTLAAMRRGADTVIFDIDLKPAQARAFENATGLKSVDRTQLILDIFAQRARSRGGKLQVELAQLQYSLPRLTEEDAGLSRLAGAGGTGGIKSRGPGETVLEIGRRRARDRIRRLEKEIENLSRQRGLRRQRRLRQGLPVLSIIGYTNAGKSTLLNALTCSDIAAADQMFVTLDTTSRRLRFPVQGEVIITDTVGFIRDLPPSLVNAFRATLEELTDADVLLHVVDASDPALERKMDAVSAILTDLELQAIPRLVVLNKADCADPALLESLCHRLEAVAVSALRREGLAELMAAAEKLLPATGV